MDDRLIDALEHMHAALALLDDMGAGQPAAWLQLAAERLPNTQTVLQ